MDKGVMQWFATQTRLLRVIVAGIFLLYTAEGYALPEGGNIAAGSGNIAQQGNTTQITQNTQKMVINWNSFNTAAHEQVNFIQPNSSAIALNRINSGLPTTFAGMLTANGQVWIINPAGVLFTSTSHVDVSGLLVSTLNIQDSNFMAGNYQFQAAPGLMNGAIINDGEIIAHGGDVAGNGLVVLVAPGVENNGVIRANLGKVALASGNAFTLDLYGDQLIQFATNSKVEQVAVAADGRVLKDAVANNGTIEANGGQVLLTANTAASVVENVVSMKGVIEAKTVSQNKNGVIILGGDEGQVNISGHVNASATTHGDGGKIIIKGHKTLITGKLSAKGGSESGNGGFIETSGDYLNVNQMTLDLSSPNGNGGLWFIDPFDIEVVAGSGTTNNSGVPAFTPSGNSSQIGANLINSQLDAGTSVTLDTGVPGGDAGNITVSSAISATTPGAATLTLRAANDVTINAGISLGQSGSLDIQNVGNTIIGAPINVGGNLLISTNGSTSLGGTITVGGNVSVISPGGITQTEHLKVTGTSLFSLAVGGLAPITLLDADNDFGGAVTLTTSNLQNATINDMNNIILGNVTVPGNLVVLAGGTITQNGANTITTPSMTAISAGGMNLSNNNAIQAIAAINSGSGNVTINNNQALNVQQVSQSGGGNVDVTSNGAMTVSTSGISTDGGSVNLTATGNNITVREDINASSGNITFNQPVRLLTGDSPDITLTGNSVLFSSTLDDTAGVEFLIINGNPTFNGVVGGIVPLVSLTINGNSTINTSAITTQGNQTYNGTMTLNQNLALDAGSAGDMTFNNTVNGAAFDLTIINANNVVDNGQMNLMNFTQSNGAGSSNFAGGIIAGNDITINTTNITGGSFTGNIVSLQGLNGVLGSATANQLFLGGSNGGNLTNSTVNGISGLAAANETQLLGGASGAFFVNNCLVGTLCTLPTTPFIPDDIPGDITIEPAFPIDEVSPVAEIILADEFREPVGFISCMMGFATALDPDGSERILMPGDSVYANEKVMTDKMSTVKVRYTDGRQVDVPGGQQYIVK